MSERKWPYIQFSLDDKEQQIYRNSMTECCVAFIDILGFSNMVISHIEKVILALGYIKNFCDSFYKFPSSRTGSEGATMLANFKTDFDIKYAEAFDDFDDDEYEQNKPTATMFSDSIVISQPIDNYFDLSEFIEFISKIQFHLLVEGILTRGGICTGNLYHEEHFVFGDGLISAYNLEHNIAIYPRIIIHQDLINKFNDLLDEKLNSHFNNYLLIKGHKYRVIYNETISDTDFIISRYILQDTDGQFFINYLGDNLHPLSAGSKEYLDVAFELLKNTYECECKSIIDTVTSGIQNKKEDIRIKHNWLKEYYNRTMRRLMHSYDNMFDTIEDRDSFFQKWDKVYIVENEPHE